MRASYICPALTLFDESMNLDFESQAALYENLIQNHIDGILVLGSMGEFFALSPEKKLELARFAIQTIGGRTRLIIGTGSMVFDEVVSFSNACLDMGADAVMVVPPYYFPLDDLALMRYFERLSQSIHGNIYIYNFPDRTGYSISANVILKLAQQHENIIGLKDTVSSMDHTRKVISTVKSERKDFEIYSGYDGNFAHNILSGGDGCIGGLANVFPEICTAWTKALRQNDANQIACGQQKVNKMFALYSVGTSFIPIMKEAARLRGIIKNSVSSFPFPSVSEKERQEIMKILA